MDTIIRQFGEQSFESTSNAKVILGLKIGEGAYGVVHKGTYDGCTAAIKIFHFSKGAERRDTIENEIQLLRQLKNHRHIIQFFGAAYHNDDVWLITDYAECGSLKLAIDANYLTDWEDKRRIAQEIASGLEYIHYKNILHRDLKSANVLLTSRKEVKLCDFGLAVVKGLSTIPENVALCGTIRWMAPELLDGSPQYSTKSDIYAFGMVMWEMAAMCTKPFASMANPDVVKAVIRGERELLPDNMVGVTPSSSTDKNALDGTLVDGFEVYRKWIEKCWDHDPLKRPEAKEITIVDGKQSRPWRGSLIPVEKPLSITPPTGQPMPVSTKICFARDDDNVGPPSVKPTTTSEDPAVDQQLQINFLLRMAECEVVGAQVALARHYENGTGGMKKDDQRAFGWYLQAANQGHTEAMRCVSDMYATGRGVEKNDAEANKWLRLITDKDVSLSPRAPHTDLPDSRSSNDSDSSRVSWVRTASLKRLAAAQRNIGLVYAKVRNSGTDATSWLQKAAERGDATAQCELATIYFEGKIIQQSDVEAVRWFRLAAEQDDPRAQCNLGVMYALGRGVSKNYTKAVKWYTKAANQGQADAQFNLGMMNEKGRGIGQSDSEAVKWYTKAADQEHPIAQCSLGEMYENGRGVECKYTEAIKWYTKAASQLHPKAQFNLGVMHERGRGTEKNYTKAAKWYMKAAEQGYSSAQFHLGWMYANGMGVEQSNVKAVKWFTKAAQQEHPDAQFYLGGMYESGKGVLQSDEEAVYWYTKAANNGQAHAQFNLGLMYDVGRGVMRNDTEAFKWYTRAAYQDDPSAQCSLGLKYALGEGIEQNYHEAVKWYTKAAEQGLAEAQFNLGMMLEKGQGAVRSDADAIKWYLMAAKQEHPDAQFRLGVMFENGRGFRKSNVEAAIWYTKAANQGQKQAQFNLGLMYEAGRGVTQSDTEAFNWYKKAAIQEDPAAQCSLGLMYAQGKGIKQSDVEAVKWYRKAASQGQADAQRNLGWMYDLGRGVQQDDQVALEWYVKSAYQGNIFAQYNLGTMYELGIVVPKDEEKALALYCKAAEGGEPNAPYHIDWLTCPNRQVHYGIPWKFLNVVEWQRFGAARQRGAANQYAAAQYNLGRLYERGIGVRMDKNQAFEWYNQAAGRGHKDAELRMKSLLR